MESVDSREADARARARAARRARVRATARRPGIVLQAYLRDSPRAARRGARLGARRAARAHAARRPAREGRLLGPRGRGGAPARLDAAGVRGQGRLATATSRRSRAGCSTRGRSCASAIASHNLRSVAHAIAYNRADRRRRPRPRAPGAARPRRRPRGRARRHGPARAHLLPGRRPRGRHGLPRAAAAREHLQRVVPRASRRAACRSRSCWRRRDEPFANEPRARAAPRARARESLLGALRELDARLPLRVPVLDRRRARRGEALRLDRPGRARARGRAARGARPRPTSTRAVGGRRARLRDVGAHAGGRARRRAARAAAALLRERRARAGRARRCASARSRGRRRTPTSARRSTSSSTTRARRSRSTRGPPRCSRCPASATRCATRPRGVVAVIAPWNFPLAIPLRDDRRRRWRPATPWCSSRPSSRPACALALVEALREAGVPRGRARARCPATARRARRWSRDPRVHTIAFTGSSAGRPGDRRAPRPRRRAGQRHLKRVVAEMGGKNCVIVDADADLDDAVPGDRRSRRSATPARSARRPRACSCTRRSPTRWSSGSRGAVERAARSARRSDFATDVPPVIEREAQERVRALRRDRPSATGRVAAARRRCPTHGWFCRAAARRRPAAPTRRCCARRSSARCWPSSACATSTQACDVVDALAVRAHRRPVLPQPAHRRARRARARRSATSTSTATITGAMVGRQPFGGNRLSGTGSKAGGPDYLLQFVEPRVVTENTMRHGLVVLEALARRAARIRRGRRARRSAASRGRSAPWRRHVERGGVRLAGGPRLGDPDRVRVVLAADDVEQAGVVRAHRLRGLEQDRGERVALTGLAP